MPKHKIKFLISLLIQPHQIRAWFRYVPPGTPLAHEPNDKLNNYIDQVEAEYLELTESQKSESDFSDFGGENTFGNGNLQDVHVDAFGNIDEVLISKEEDREKCQRQSNVEFGEKTKIVGGTQFLDLFLTTNENQTDTKNDIFKLKKEKLSQKQNSTGQFYNKLFSNNIDETDVIYQFSNTIENAIMLQSVTNAKVISINATDYDSNEGKYDFLKISTKQMSDTEFENYQTQQQKLELRQTKSISNFIDITEPTIIDAIMLEKQDQMHLAKIAGQQMEPGSLIVLSHKITKCTPGLQLVSESESLMGDYIDLQLSFMSENRNDEKIQMLKKKFENRKIFTYMKTVINGEWYDSIESQVNTMRVEADELWSDVGILRNRFESLFDAIFENSDNKNYRETQYQFSLTPEDLQLDPTIMATKRFFNQFCETDKFITKSQFIENSITTAIGSTSTTKSIMECWADISFYDENDLSKMYTWRKIKAQKNRFGFCFFVREKFEI